MRRCSSALGRGRLVGGGTAERSVRDARIQRKVDVNRKPYAAAPLQYSRRSTRPVERLAVAVEADGCPSGGAPCAVAAAVCVDIAQVKLEVADFLPYAFPFALSQRPAPECHFHIDVEPDYVVREYALCGVVIGGGAAVFHEREPAPDCIRGVARGDSARIGLAHSSGHVGHMRGSSVSARGKRAALGLAHPIRDALGYHYSGDVGVGAYDVGHNGCVHHA